MQVVDKADSREAQGHVADHGHHPLVGQPHSDDEGPIAEAEQRAAQLRSDRHRFGQRGQRIDRRSPFYLGMMASAGVALTYGAVRDLGSMSSVLVLIGVAMFFALGLESAVSWLVNRKLRRWAAVTIVVAVMFSLVAGTLAAAIPPLVEQARQFANQLPHYIQLLQDHSSVIGRLNERIHLQERITEMINSSGRFTVAGVVKAGTEVFGALSHVGVVTMLTVYFLADMRRIRAGFYRLFPNSRRPRAILIGDEVVAKFGNYLVGNVLTSVIAGAATFVWCIAFDIPHPVLLGVINVPARVRPETVTRRPSDGSPSNGRALGLEESPHWCGCLAASSTVTSTPAFARVTAAARPLGPAPTTVAVLMPLRGAAVSASADWPATR